MRRCSISRVVFEGKASASKTTEKINFYVALRVNTRRIFDSIKRETRV
jgi:hypothetical protein